MDLVGVLPSIPDLLFGMVAGVLADRNDRRLAGFVDSVVLITYLTLRAASSPDKLIGRVSGTFPALAAPPRGRRPDPLRSGRDGGEPRGERRDGRRVEPDDNETGRAGEPIGQLRVGSPDGR